MNILTPLNQETVTIKPEYLNQFKTFINQYESFSEEEFSHLTSLFKVRTVQKNTEIVQQGNICKSLWFIIEGSFRAYHIDPDGNDLTTDFAFENQFMTSFKSYRTGKESDEFIIALSNSILLEANLGSIESNMKHLTTFKSTMLKIIEFAFICMEERSFALQHYSAEKRYTDLLENADSRILERVPLVYISSYLGISPETLSRVRKKIIS